MPDHLHLLLAGLREDASLIPCVEVMRQRSSRAAKTAQGIQLWQDGYFERVLRDDEHLEVAAQYIFENPVRANLVGNAKDWPHSGGRFWRLSYCVGPSFSLGNDARAKARAYGRGMIARLKLGPTDEGVIAAAPRESSCRRTAACRRRSRRSPRRCDRSLSPPADPPPTPARRAGAARRTPRRLRSARR